MLPLLLDETLRSSPSDFGIEVSPGQLRVSPSLHATLQRLGIRSGESFYSALVSTPSAFGGLSGAGELETARAAALRTLEPFLSPSLVALAHHDPTPFPLGSQPSEPPEGFASGYSFLPNALCQQLVAMKGQASDTDVVAFLRSQGLSPGEASVALMEVLAYTPDQAKRAVSQG